MGSSTTNSTPLNPFAPDEIMRLILNRRSVRGYTDEPVSEESLHRILRAGQLAPSACNGQPWHFLVVRDNNLRQSVAECTSDKMLGLNHFTRKAPVIIVLIQEHTNFTARVGSAIKGTQFPLIDIGIAAAQICLQATAEGLGSCCIGWVDQNRIRKALRIPKSKNVPLIITLGHPEKPLLEIQEKKRKALEQIVSYDQYGNSTPSLD